MVSAHETAQHAVERGLRDACLPAHRRTIPSVAREEFHEVEVALLAEVGVEAHALEVVESNHRLLWFDFIGNSIVVVTLPFLCITDFKRATAFGASPTIDNDR